MSKPRKARKPVARKPRNSGDFETRITLWEEAYPLHAAVHFVGLVGKYYQDGLGPMVFVFETVVSCMEPDELGQFERATRSLADIACREQKRRQYHKSRPRPRDKEMWASYAAGDR